MMVIQVNPNSLSYELSPTNYNNSPSNYDNSVTNYDNSPSNYDNSPSNYENSSGRNRLYNQERVIVGYAVYSPIGTLNIFSTSGRRLGYVPATNNTQSISIGGELALANEQVMIRAGLPYIGQKDKIETFTTGIGFRYSSISGVGLGFNYSYNGYKYLGDINKLSLQIYF